MTTARRFLDALFLHAEGNVWLTSLSNDGSDTPFHYAGSLEDLEFAPLAGGTKWDSPGRGLFFCVSTIRKGGKRCLADVQQMVGLHIDIDLKDIHWDVTPFEGQEKFVVKDRLQYLECPPSYIIDSGNGVHAYWLFDEPGCSLDWASDKLRQLCRYLSGDYACCEPARLMRLPGSHNTKNGAWHEVKIMHETGRRYSPPELSDWINNLPFAPLIHRKEPEKKSISDRARSRMPSDNAFLDAAKAVGYRPRLDVQDLLGGMTSGNIHNTQLLASASLMATGVDHDVAVEMIMKATERVAGAGWNWNRERQTVEELCRSGRDKYRK